MVTPLRPVESEVSMIKRDVTIRLGGEGGEGVISAGDLLAELLANTSYHVLTHRTYPAEIKGGLAMIQVRVSPEALLSQGTAADVLMAFNDEAVEAYRDVIKEGGWLLYDPDLAPRAAEFAEHSYAMPLNKLAKDASGTTRGKNIVAVGILGAMLGLDKGDIAARVARKFARKGDKVAASNALCLEAGWQFAADHLPRLPLAPATPAAQTRVMMNGNAALSAGALAGNVRFMAGYPITPASGILEYMAAQLPRFGGIAMQAEDEIAALAACLGASFGGVRAISATSGPGLSLMVEQIGLSAMAELPLVIVDVQRGGPSTGLPTKQEQSDLHLAYYGAAGDVPKLILAPLTVEDCFYTAVDAANAAEAYQTPVILLSDTTLAVRTQTFPMPDPAVDRVSAFAYADAEAVQGRWKRYEDTPSGVSRRSLPGTDGGMHIVTGLEHDEDGHAQYTGANHERMHAKRYRKLASFLDAFARPAEIHQPVGARIGVIGWGSTYGTILEARAQGEQIGLPVAHCQLRLISPLPTETIVSFCQGLDTVLVVEENYTGQLAGIIRAQTGLAVHSYARSPCGPLTPEEILARIKEAQ